jgi:nicotinic acid phosphoribosyltransferase
VSCAFARRFNDFHGEQLLNIALKAKDIILARDGKLVIRPDSGDPVDILCGLPKALKMVGSRSREV